MGSDNKYVYHAGDKTHQINGNNPTGTLSVSYTWNGNAVTDFASESTKVTVVKGSNTFTVS